MNIPFVDLQAEYQNLKTEIDSGIAAVLDQSDYILGQAVTEFEATFAAYCEAGYAVGVDSGYAALELILHAHHIGPGDEVITAANSFIATALAISNCGARPVLVDVDPVTCNLDPHQIETAVTPQTRAIIPVHLYGRPADMDPILEIARKYELLVFEDACQAHGARYRGRRTGGLADAAAFSFYPSKNLGAYGDGGIVVTNDSRTAERIRMLRNVGQAAKYHHAVKGFNHRLDSLQAAILCAKLPYLDEGNGWRRETAALYDQLLADSPVTTPAGGESEHVYHLYVIQTDRREQLQAHLNAAGIANGIHYPIPIHRQPAYADLAYAAGAFPVTEQLAERIVSLPMYPGISTDAVRYTADNINQFFST